MHHATLAALRRLCLLIPVLLPLSGNAQDTTITYQGQLRQAGTPFTGTVHLEFRLFDALSGGSQVGTTQTRPAWPVEDGLFQVDLDFGTAAFTEQVRYLDVRVDGAPLNPRQAIRPSPMALFALGGNEGPAGPPGPPGPAGPAGPPGTSPFTLDPVSGTIEYLFGNQRFRLEPDPNSDEAPRLTIGQIGNQNSAIGGVIAGGGTSDEPNRITAGRNGVIGGGTANHVAESFGTIAGGTGNIAGAVLGTVGGGGGNFANSARSTIAGGFINTADGDESAVGGGTNNVATGQRSTIAGGVDNRADARWSSVGGGVDNLAIAEASRVGGGGTNAAAGRGSTVTGGSFNCAGGDFSWAGGYRAKIRPNFVQTSLGSGCSGIADSGDPDGDNGTFVWADSEFADFVSTGANQFLVRAAGGMGIGTNRPEAQLHIEAASPVTAFDAQLILDGAEQTGALDTGGALLFQGHDGNIPRAWASIQGLKENGTVGNTRSHLRFLTRGTSGLAVRMRIDSNGTTFNTSGTWSTLSDGRLKTDIDAIPDALDRLTRLRGVTFRYTDPDRAMGADGPRMGFIAEEVEQVFPGWVGATEDGYRFLTMTGFEAVVVEALKGLQQRGAEAIGQRDRQIAALYEGLERVETENRELRAELAIVRSQAERNAELEARLATLEEMLLVGRRLAGAE